MFRWFFAAAALLLVPSTASATWSVIAVDRSTGRVVIASATCVEQRRRVPQGRAGGRRAGQGRRGVPGGRRRHAHESDARVQRAAEGHRSGAHHRAAERGSRVSERGSSAFSICRAAAPGTRASRTATSRRTSRARCRARRSSIRSRATSCGPGEVVPNAVKAFLQAKGAITDRVMAAMEAADGSGGDSRCTCPPPPTDGSTPAIPCDGKTAHVAYILMAEPKRHERRLAQQRQVHDVHHRVAAGAAERTARTRSRRRESQSGEDAARCATTRGARRSRRSFK